jgi:divalent metal cation (Fe/Co/Zn/Cd) transporter
MRSEALSGSRPAADEHARLVRVAKTLSWLSILWMVIEASVGIIAAVIAGSVALLGFGLDSLIEVASAGTIIWRFSGGRVHSEQTERRAQQLIALCFLALAVYLTIDSITSLASSSRPQTSWAGVGVSATAIVLMPLLATAKRDIATRLGSSATASDAAQSWLCALIAAGTLTSLLANALLGWWWLDPVIGLAIAAIALQESRRAFAGEACADCAPIALDTPTAGSASPTAESHSHCCDHPEHTPSQLANSENVLT